MHWSLVILIIAILCFVVCRLRTYHSNLKVSSQRIIFKSLGLAHKYLTIHKPKYFALYFCLCIHQLLNQDVAIQKICFSKLLLTAPQFINQTFISKSVPHMMLQNSGMICHWKFELPQHFYVSKGNIKPICFRSLSLHSFSDYLTPMVPLGMTR